MADGNVGTIYYTVDAHTEGLLDAVKALTESMNKMNGRFEESDKKAKKLDTSMSSLARAIKAVIAASAIREMAGMVQKYQEMAERVQMATSSQAEFEMVQRRLMDTANGTYRALDEAQELYIRTADSLRSMGYSTEQALDVTDSMSYAFVKNATSADRADASISALSKSINTGKVAADQWETITSAIPSVINDIASASGKTAAEVRALGAAGKLTAKDLTEGLRKSLEENAKAAEGMANNMTDAGVRMRTALTAVLVSLEDQTGALQALTDGLIQAADAVLSFAGDEEMMAGLLQATELAAMSLAAVIAGRVVMALAAASAQFYRSAAAMGVATTAANGLRAAVSFLGGPAGIAILAATAIYQFGLKSKDASSQVATLRKEVQSLSQAQADLEKLKMPDVIAAATKRYEDMAAGVAKMESAKNVRHAEAFNKTLAHRRVRAEELKAELDGLIKRQEELNNWSPTAKPKTSGGDPDPAVTPTVDTDAIQKQIAALELQADTLGLTSSELAIYKLELAGATDEQIRAAQSSLSMIDAYEQQEQALEDLAKAREAFGTDVAGKVRGDVSPLSGGAFDNQIARYQAEADAEKQRYAEQIERLHEAKRLELEVKGGYQTLEEEMAKEHAARMAQIQMAQAQMVLAAGEQGFGALADVMKTAHGEQSSQYKAMFAISKAFSIAQATMSIASGIAQAAANPWPLNLAAMASVAGATAGLVSTISSVTMGSGRQYGGPVSPGSMHRINENGAPEVFKAANGQQYMLPNTRGEVVSNADASGGGKSSIQVINNGPPMNARQEMDGDQIRIILDMAEDRAIDSMARGKLGRASQAAFGLKRASR